jgi:general secretion pathway protein E
MPDNINEIDNDNDDGPDTSSNPINAWVEFLFDELHDDELHDPQVLEVTLKPAVGDASVECRSSAGPVRQYSLPSHLVAGVLAKMKKLAQLDVAERRRIQSGRVRLLNFHGHPTDFEVTTAPAGESETVTLRRV